MVTSRARQRLRASHRSTALGLGGLGLIALGLVLTYVGVGGRLMPTILALVGGLVFVAGIAVGAQLVFDNFRFRRDQSYYDPDEEDDE